MTDRSNHKLINSSKEKTMDRKKIISAVDHTLLLQGATWEEIKQICADACTYETASVCIPPSYVKRASDYLAGRIPVCTVIGFPNGYQTTAVKVFETQDAIANGAAEIDMVINIGDLKDRAYDRIEEEIRQIKAACKEKVLKVIIETCLLTDEEKIKMCEIVTSAGATFEDVDLFSKHVGPKVKIKAAGGISSFEDAEKFMELGASRLGTSRIVKLAKSEQEHAGQIEGY